jgi:flagellar hook-basal body complex protein FliE
MELNQINPIGPIREPESKTKVQGTGAQQANAPSFKDTLNSFMSDVNNLQQKADVSIQKMAAGQITDVHQVMESVEEANTAFNMMMEIRNKVMDAYQEVMRIRL